jgi:hypothetical protein
MHDEAFPPLADGMPVTIQLFGKLLVGGVVAGGGEEDEAAAERQGLGRRAGAGEGMERVAELRREYDP